MRRILVTGANKGIGYAIAERILEEADDTFVFLGSRDLNRGIASAKKLQQAGADRANRLQVVPMDVASDQSVEAAARKVREALGDEMLYGIVNNAGTGLGSFDLHNVLNVNTRGVQRVCSAFIPLIADGGRVVNITSAAGPNYLSKCSDQWKAFFTRSDVTWSEMDALMNELIDITGQADAFSSRGLSDGSPYGLSKALANTYTRHLAHEHPHLTINACTPGFVATDLTLEYERKRGQDPEKSGMKSPREGAQSAIFLLFGELDGSGNYYGSDAKRSPLDRYRAPGSPPYVGN